MITWPALAILALLAGASGGMGFALFFSWLEKRGRTSSTQGGDPFPAAAEPAPFQAAASLPGVTEDKHPDRRDPDEVEQSEQRRTRNQGRWRW